MSERLSNLVLLVRCYGRFLLHGRANAQVTNPRCVVIVQFGKLGDMVCTTPVFRAIKQKFPQARVVVVGDRAGGSVLAGNADVDRYIICGKQDVAKTLAALREETPDAGLTAGPSMRGFALLYLAGAHLVVAPQVVGRKSSEGTFYKLVRMLGVLRPHRIGQYAPREYLNLLEPFGITTDDTTKHLAVATEAKERVENFLQEKGLADARLIGIASSAGNKLKNWPAERLAAVADYCAQKYNARVVVLGAPSDKPESDALIRSAKITPLDTTGLFSIEELKALIAQLEVFIGVDTGPIYIAEALGVPTIDIVGPMDENEQPPRGPRNLVVVPPFERTPELFIMSPGIYNETEARRQAQSITVKQVTDAVDVLMARKS